MYTYKAYGLGIHSALSLPELDASAEIEQPDVVIQTGKIDWKPPGGDRPASYFDLAPSEAYLFWDLLGTFLVRDGREIVIDSVPDVEDRLLRLPLLGAVLAVLLQQRGFLVLHASAVAINDNVVAFIGEKGRGKSTMAAMLYGRGHDFVADDIVAIDMTGKSFPLVAPGFPQLKLWPEAAAFSLNDDPTSLPQISSICDKRARRVFDKFSQTSLPLKGIYALGEAPAPELSLLRPQMAITQLIANSYIARFGNQILQGSGAASHLRQCVDLANRVKIYGLDRPMSLQWLSTAAEQIEGQSSQ